MSSCARWAAAVLVLAACSSDPRPSSEDAVNDGGTSTSTSTSRSDASEGLQLDAGSLRARHDASAEPSDAIVASDADVEVADDLPPELDAATMAALQALRYDDGPPPLDPSNAFADDPTA